MRVAQRTEVGLRRERNEDALLTDRQRGLFVVADGMGGHPAGDVASQVAVDSLDGFLGPSALDSDTGKLPSVLAEALHHAHRAILQTAEQSPSRRGMGTTAVVLKIAPDESLLTLAHVGDSRAYLLRDGEARRLTVDHTQGGIFGNALTQALGIEGDLEPEPAEVELERGDRILLCTDGLTDLISDEELADLSGDAQATEEFCETLVHTALDRGGHDNVTAIVIDPEPS